jgi:hypothetical protein
LSQSDLYYRCGGCGNLVDLKKMDLHYTSNHKDGIAQNAPVEVANPAPMPTFQGRPLPPVLPQQATGSIGFDILYMKRSYPKAFIVYTGIVALLTALFISSIFVDILIFHL